MAAAPGATGPSTIAACPVCGEVAASRTVDVDAAGTHLFTCPRCGEFRITDADLAGLLRLRAGGTAGEIDRGARELEPPRTGELAGRADGAASPDAFDIPANELYRVSGYLRELTLAGQGGARVTPESLDSMRELAPSSLSERIDRFILNLARMSDTPGCELHIDASVDHVLAYAATGGELAYIIEYLVGDGTLDREGGHYHDFRLAMKGWMHAEALRQDTVHLMQAFVAMSFDPALDVVYREGIAPAVRDAGFQPLVLSHDEHTGQVDDRIILELNRSRFVVAEFAEHRQSVYFEAGYAVGRGVPVIWTCRAEDYAHAHFDTRQYNHIVWNSVAELRERLYTRIRVVVG